MKAWLDHHCNRNNQCNHQRAAVWVKCHATMTQNKFPSTLTNYLHIYLTHHGLFSFVGDVMNVQRGCQYSLLSRAGHFYAIRLMQSGWVQICPEEVYCMSFSQFSCLLYTLLSTRIKRPRHTYIKRNAD